MAKIAKNLTELIGRTPLMELAEYSRKYGLKQNIIAKLEAFNPAGSVKDRVALAMIEDAIFAFSIPVIEEQKLPVP